MLTATDETLTTMSRAFGRVRRMQQLELSRFCLPHLLRYEDRNSMAWSIEARVPFVTTDVMETALALPPEGKIRNGFSKHSIRMLAAQLLPPEIAWRKRKFGFEAPTSLWLKQHEVEVGREIRRLRHDFRHHAAAGRAVAAGTGPALAPVQPGDLGTPVPREPRIERPCTPTTPSRS